jgi:hypothetical protein
MAYFNPQVEPPQGWPSRVSSFLSIIQFLISVYKRILRVVQLDTWHRPSSDMPKGLFQSPRRTTQGLALWYFMNSQPDIFFNCSTEKDPEGGATGYLAQSFFRYPSWPISTPKWNHLKAGLLESHHSSV